MIIILLLLGNLILGLAVLTIIDDKDQSLFHWYKNCPEQISWIIQPIILMFWFVILGFWIRYKYKNIN